MSKVPMIRPGEPYPQPSAWWFWLLFSGAMAFSGLLMWFIMWARSELGTK